MRYRELYELIDMGLLKANIAFPMSENMKEFLADQAIDKLGETVVLKKRVLVTATAGKVKILKSRDMTDKIYKVEVGEKNLPFISEENVNPNVEERNFHGHLQASWP